MWKSKWTCLWILPLEWLIKFTLKNCPTALAISESSRQYWYFMRQANQKLLQSPVRGSSAHLWSTELFILDVVRKGERKDPSSDNKKKKNVTLELRTLKKRDFVFLPWYSFTCGFIFHKRGDKHTINQRQKWKVTLSSFTSLGNCYQHCLFWHC